MLQATNFLIRFAQRDQVVAVPISIGRAIKKTGGGTIKSDTQVEYLFEVPTELLDDLFYPRLRGVVLYIVLQKGQRLKGAFSAQVKAPQRGRVRYFDKSMQLALATYRSPDGTILVPANIAAPWKEGEDSISTATGRNELCQKDAPPARTARVQERNAIGGYDVCGTVAFANLSPIGGRHRR